MISIVIFDPYLRHMEPENISGPENNLLGCSFATAAAMLCGLLLYDVFWVFGSSHVFGDNVMVTVSNFLIHFSCFLDLSQALSFDCMHVFESFELQFSQKVNASHKISELRSEHKKMAPDVKTQTLKI